MVFTEREFSMLKRAKLAKSGADWINSQTRKAPREATPPIYFRAELKKLIVESLKYDFTSPDSPRAWFELRQALDFADGYIANLTQLHAKTLGELTLARAASSTPPTTSEKA